MMTLTYAGIELANGTTSTVSFPGVSDAHKVQTAEPIAGEEPLFFDRLTRSKQLQAAVLRQNASFERALWRGLVGVDALPGKGVLALEYTDGAGVVHRYWCNAAKPSSRTEPTGISDVTTYNFECGRWNYDSTDSDSYAGDVIDGDDLTSELDGGSFVDDETGMLEVDGGIEGSSDPDFMRIKIRSGTLAQLVAAGAGINAREPWYTTDYGRKGMGPLTTYYRFDDVERALDTVTVSTSGDTSVALLSWARRHWGMLIVGTGVATYTRNVVLPLTVTGVDGVSSCAFLAGDSLELLVQVQAGTYATANFYSGSTGGTNLLQFTAESGVTHTYRVAFRHNGTSWTLADLNEFAA